MNQTSQTKPNILLTEVCNRSCRYCFAKDEMALAKKKEMDFSDFEKVLDFLEKNGQKEVRIMGGEPTLHSRFRDIIDLALARGFQVKLFTNGFFPEDLAEFLSEVGGLVEYSFNLTAIVSDTSQKREIAEKNLEKLAKVSRVYGSITVDSPGFDPKELTKLVKKNKITLLRLGIANNMVENTGRGISRDYEKIVQKTFSVAKEFKEKAGVSTITLSCGLTPCMLSDDQKKEISSGVLKLRGWGCSGKVSHFDVSSELETFPCFYSENFQEKNFFSFKKIFSLKFFHDGIIRYLISDLSKNISKDCQKCPHFKFSQCFGPCLGYFQKNRKATERIKKLKGNFRFLFFGKTLGFFLKNKDRMVDRKN